MPGMDDAFYAESVDAWRAWLEEHCRTAESVWLIVHHRKSTTPSVHFHESLEHALCFGWVDSKAHKRDAESFYLCFIPRDPNSAWSAISRRRAERMIATGQMTPRGQAAIDLAKRTGKWDALTAAQECIVPDDLQRLLDENAVAAQHFHAFPPPSQRVILEWIAKARRADTRARRLAETVKLAAMNIRANH
jgi:uncharacterized protein YdeI (YjbR/CyaY-like superfamily)